MPKPPPDADSTHKELESLVSVEIWITHKFSHFFTPTFYKHPYFILFPQLGATVHLQEIDNDIQGSIFMSIARVYHIKIESDDLEECGADKTKCWTGTVDLAKIRALIFPSVTFALSTLSKTTMNQFLGLFATFLT